MRYVTAARLKRRGKMLKLWKKNVDLQSEEHPPSLYAEGNLALLS